MIYTLLADILVALHLAIVLFVVAGLAVIWIGAWRRWGWIRNAWFRLAHLAAIVFVALQAVLGLHCPLTMWEYRLRALAGQGEIHGSFVGRILSRFLYYDFPEWAFTVAYTAFGLLVLATFIAAPPRRLTFRRRRDTDESGSSPA